MITRLVAFGRFWASYRGPLFTLPFIFLPALAHSKRWRWVLIAGVFYALSQALNPWFLPHHAAPAMGILLLALIQAARILFVARAGSRRPFACLVFKIALAKFYKLDYADSEVSVGFAT